MELESRQKDSQLRELGHASSLVKAELESSRAGHEEYKSKAKKVLLEKENIIGALRAEPGTGARGVAMVETTHTGFEEAELQQAL